MFTFADLLTGAGVAAAAVAITLLISVVKTALLIAANWHGAAMAFLLSALLYVAAAFALATFTPDALLMLFLSWLACAAAAVGVHKTLVNPVVEAVQTKTG